MQDFSGIPIERRIRLIRRARGMSQVLLAHRVGRSRAWVQQVERGALLVDRLSVIYRVAEALNVDPRILLDQPFLLRDGESWSTAGVPAIRRALLTVPGPARDGGRGRSLDALRSDIFRARDLRVASRYLDLAARIPLLLGEAQAAVYQDTGAQAAEAHRLLAHICQLTSGLLHRLGEADLAFVASTLGMTAAEQGGDLLLTAAGSRHLVNILFTTGRLEEARQVSLAHAARLDRALDQAPKPQISVYGILQLKAAVASARLQDRARTRDFIAEAGRAATILDEDRNDFWTAFGPTNVAIHRVQLAVELGDAGHALDLSEQVDVERLPDGLLERRASHAVDVARAAAMRGKGGEAVRQLLIARRFAPEELRYQSMGRNLIVQLLETERRVSPELRGLARHVGIVANG